MDGATTVIFCSKTEMQLRDDDPTQCGSQMVIFTALRPFYFLNQFYNDHWGKLLVKLFLKNVGVTTEYSRLTKINLYNRPHKLSSMEER